MTARLLPIVKIRKVNHQPTITPKLSFSALKIKAVGSRVQTHAHRMRSGGHYERMSRHIIIIQFIILS